MSGLDEYADGCKIQEGADWYPFLSGGGTGRGIWGVWCPSEVSTPKSIHAFQIIKNTLLGHSKKIP
jgi:hypothetical protein